MDRFKRILTYLPPYGSPNRALERAVKLARRNQAELTIVDVAHAPVSHYLEVIPEAMWSSTLDREERLRIKTSWIDEEDVSYTTHVLHGRPGVEIVKQVLRGQHDLLIKDVCVDGDDDDSFFFGSLDMRLLRNCPCPVWLVKPKQDVAFETVLAAIDCQSHDEHGSAMNRAILELASSLKDTEASTVHLVSAWEGPGEGDISENHLESSAMEEYLTTAKAQAQTYIESITNEFHVAPENVHFVHGKPHQTIKQQAAEIGAHLIVMGTLARSGVPGLLMGNTAEKVLRSVQCSVLTLKPAGFCSPIELDD